MTISSVTSKVIYVGTGSTASAAKIFAYPFKILAAGDLTVSEYNNATSVATVKVLTTDYAVTNVGIDAGGNVILTGSYTNLPTGSQLVIQRIVDLTQETDYVENDPFPASSHENALDKLTMATQQIQEQLDRAILGDVTQTSSNITYAAFATLSDSSTSSATVAIAQASNAVVQVTLATAQTSTATVYATQASSSASAAGSSATVALNASNAGRFIRVTIIDPYNTYATSPAICLLESLNAAITVQGIDVTCNANPAVQVSGNLLYADAFIGTASPVAIDKINTTSGVLHDASISNAAVAAGKTIYLQFDAQPTASITQINVNVKYAYN